MTEVPAPPVPILPDAWDAVDTSIDAEAPELLSPDQFERHVEAVTALLTAAGLEVRTPDPKAPTQLRITGPRTSDVVEIDLYDDRTADWTITGEGQVPDGTPARTLAAIVAGLFGAGRSG